MDKCLPVIVGLTEWRSPTYRDEVELSMAAAACLRWAQVTSKVTEKSGALGRNASYSWAHGDSQDGTPPTPILSGAPE
ncbi:hypothetical protein GCM10010424_26420 [Streptomyces lienomycini]